MVTQADYVMPQAFCEGLVRPRWDRFDAYARRIRVLNHSDFGSTVRVESQGDKIQPESLTQLLSCLPFNHGPLLPNVRELTWTSYRGDEFYTQALSFLSPPLHTLRICSEDDESAPTPRLHMIQGLAGRPDLNLSRLDLHIDLEDHSSLSSATASLLKAQEQLQNVALRQFHLSGPIARALPNLPGLRELSASVVFTDSHQLGVFFSNLAAGCRALEGLRLRIHPPSDSDPLELSFRPIAPLLQMYALSALHLTGPHYPENACTISLQETNIVAMGEAWPYMKHLELSSPTPISLLPIYAKCFQALESLRITLILHPASNFNMSTPKFRSLRKLSIEGNLSRTGGPAIAAFLSWLCPAKTKFDHLGNGTRHSAQWAALIEMVRIGHQLQEATAGQMGTTA